MVEIDEIVMDFSRLFSKDIAKCEDGDVLASIIGIHVMGYLSYRDVMVVSMTSRFCAIIVWRRLFSVHDYCKLSDSNLLFNKADDGLEMGGNCEAVCNYAMSAGLSRLKVTVCTNPIFNYTLGIRRPAEIVGSFSLEHVSSVENVYFRICYGGRTSTVVHNYWVMRGSYAEVRASFHRWEHGSRDRDNVLPGEVTFVMSYMTNLLRIECREMKYVADFSEPLSGPYIWSIEFGPNPSCNMEGAQATINMVSLVDGKANL